MSITLISDIATPRWLNITTLLGEHKCSYMGVASVHMATEFSSDPTFRVWIQAAAWKESGAYE